MIRYAYKLSQSGLQEHGYADKIRVCYTKELIRVILSFDETEFVLVLSDEWNPDHITEFQCDKFSIEVDS